MITCLLDASNNHKLTSFKQCDYYGLRSQNITKYFCELLQEVDGRIIFLLLFIQVFKVDSSGDQDNYRIYIMTAAVQEMQYNSYVFIIHQTETVLYSQIHRNYIVIFIITRIAFTDISCETFSCSTSIVLSIIKFLA